MDFIKPVNLPLEVTVISEKIYFRLKLKCEHEMKGCCGLYWKIAG
jgi:hypothetical protein